METIIKIILSLFSIFRHLENENKLGKTETIVEKLSSDLEYRKSKLAGLTFAFGTYTNPDFEIFFNTIKEQAPRVKTKKH